MQAGHLYPVSTHPHLRFHPINVNGECLRCNYFDSQSHQQGYLPNLIQRVGIEAVEQLQLLANSRTIIKNDRLSFIEIILQYESYAKKK